MSYGVHTSRRLKQVLNHIENRDQSKVQNQEPRQECWIPCMEHYTAPCTAHLSRSSGSKNTMLAAGKSVLAIPSILLASQSLGTQHATHFLYYPSVGASGGKQMGYRLNKELIFSLCVWVVLWVKFPPCCTSYWLDFRQIQRASKSEIKHGS